MKKLVLLLILCVSLKVFGLSDEQMLEAGVYSIQWGGVYESEGGEDGTLELKEDGDRVYFDNLPAKVYVGIRGAEENEKEVILKPSEKEKSDRIKLDKVYLADDGNGHKLEIQPYARVFWRYKTNSTSKYLVVADVWMVIRGAHLFKGLDKNQLIKLPNYLDSSGSVSADNIGFSTNSRENSGKVQNLYLKVESPDEDKTHYTDLSLIVKVSVTVANIPNLEIVENESDLLLSLGAGLSEDTLGGDTHKIREDKIGYDGAYLKIKGASYALVKATHPDKVIIYKDGDQSSGHQMEVDLKFDRNSKGIDHFGDEGVVFLNQNERLEDVGDDGDTGDDYWTADTIYYIDGKCVIPSGQEPGVYSGGFDVVVKYEY